MSMTDKQIEILMDFVSQFYKEFVIHGTTDDGELETSIVYYDGNSKSWNFLEKAAADGQLNVFGPEVYDETTVEFEADGDWLDED